MFLSLKQHNLTLEIPSYNAFASTHHKMECIMMFLVEY